ncbi:MAG: hypothetical protein HGB19_11845 [Chlorobiales bacterium]|nr:hypothetical protein [Chlorobiales bacterium]
MEIFLARHLEVDIDVSRFCIGQTDVLLSRKAKSRLAQFSEELKSLHPEALISSDLVRCKDIAEKVAEDTGIFLKTDPLWREVNFGEWENRAWNDLWQSDHDRVDHWMQNFVSAVPPGGESYMMLFQRIHAQLDRLADRTEKRILVVTHAGVIRSAISFVLGMPLERSFSLEIKFGCLTGLRCEDGRWSLFSLRNPLE